MYWHHVVFDIHALKRGRREGKGLTMKNSMHFFCQIFTTLKLQHFVQKDLAFDVNPMLFCLLLQALQYAIRFLAGKETDVLSRECL